MKFFRKSLALVIALTLTLMIPFSVYAEPITEDYTGKIVVLHSNDVHGAIDGYAKLTQLKKDYENAGATVVTVDAGDFSQGSIYVSDSKGDSAAKLMSSVGYDVIALGNHEFDYGQEVLNKNIDTIEAIGTKVLCSNVIYNSTGKSYSDQNCIINKNGINIGFFGIMTPEIQTNSSPTNLVGLHLLTNSTSPTIYEDAQNQINTLKAEGADVVIGLVHLGINESAQPYRSTDLYSHLTGCDFIVDGHSHTEVLASSSSPIQQTGTKFSKIGKFVIDSANKSIDYNDNSCELIDPKNLSSDPTVEAQANAIIADIDERYGTPFATSEVDLNGTKGSPEDPGTRNSETNLGDLMADALKWKAISIDSDSISNDNFISIFNGASIRESLPAGDVCMKDLLSIEPFSSTLNIITLKGSELLEALEASTFACPNVAGAFPQASGIDFTINIAKEYNPNDTPYPDSTYFGPKTIERVTINSINGIPFDPNATYKIATNPFCTAGGDTYYTFKNSLSKIDSGLLVTDIMKEYILSELGGVIDSRYAAPRGTTHIVNEITPEPVPVNPDEPIIPDDTNNAAIMPSNSASTSDENSIYLLTFIFISAIGTSSIIRKKYSK